MSISLILFIFIIILQVILAFIPSSGKITDNRKAGFNKLTKKGKTFLIFSVICVILLIIQYIHQDYINEKVKLKANKESNKKDSITQLKVKKDNEEMMRIIISELGKYKLELDSANKKIVRLLNDSAKRTEIYNFGKDPSFSICPDDGINIIQQENKNTLFKFKFCYENSPSNIKINTLVYSKKQDQILFIDSIAVITTNLDLSSGQSVNSHYFEVKDKNIVNNLYFHLIGSYTDRSNKKKFTIDFIYVYDLNKGIYGQPSSEIVEKIIRNYKAIQKQNNKF